MRVPGLQCSRTKFDIIIENGVMPFGPYDHGYQVLPLSEYNRLQFRYMTPVQRLAHSPAG